MQCVDKNKNSLTRFIKIWRGSYERVLHNHHFLGFLPEEWILRNRFYLISATVPLSFFETYLTVLRVYHLSYLFILFYVTLFERRFPGWRIRGYQFWRGVCKFSIKFWTTLMIIFSINVNGWFAISTHFRTIRLKSLYKNPK